MKLIETPKINNIDEMNQYFKELTEKENKLIILVLDLINEDHLKLKEKIANLDNDEYNILILNSNEFLGLNFVLNLDVIITPALFVFHNGKPDSNLLGIKQIEQFINILKYKK